MLQALGVRLLDAKGRELAHGGGALAGLERIDVARLDPRLAASTIEVACDVDNPLVGPIWRFRDFRAAEGRDARDRAHPRRQPRPLRRGHRADDRQIRGGHARRGRRGRPRRRPLRLPRSAPQARNRDRDGRRRHGSGRRRRRPRHHRRGPARQPDDPRQDADRRRLRGSSAMANPSSPLRAASDRASRPCTTTASPRSSACCRGRAASPRRLPKAPSTCATPPATSPRL